MQIGHLEALQDLFAEALRCARHPFGIDKDGNPMQPQVVYSVRDLADQAFLSKLPTYEELLPIFSDHLFATEEGIDILRKHDHSTIILAANDAYDKHLVLFGAELVNSNEKAMVVRVSSFSELQFAIAAIRKFVGIPSTDGSPWKDM